MRCEKLSRPNLHATNKAGRANEPALLKKIIKRKLP
jgi:hypothetical protein